MEIATLIFILSFLAIISVLVTSTIRYMCKKKDEVSKEVIPKKKVNEKQEKWKLTIPKHSTRIKLRASRKLRNKRNGKKK